MKKIAQLVLMATFSFVLTIFYQKESIKKNNFTPIKISPCANEKISPSDEEVISALEKALLEQEVEPQALSFESLSDSQVF